jgi:hypothetical protein
MSRTCRHCGAAIRWLKALRRWATDDLRQNIGCPLSPTERHEP